MADGRMISSKRQILLQLADALGIPHSIVYNFETQYHTHSSYSSSSHKQRTQYDAPIDELADAYKTLGIDKTTTDVHVKKAYRKLVSLNHPDKLVSKGLPPEMIRLATSKTQKIHHAYEIIQQARGMK
jgi:DnaJ like chaperone protein